MAATASLPRVAQLHHHRRGGFMKRRPIIYTCKTKRNNPLQALPNDDAAFDLSTLTKRMEALKRQEETGSTATIQVGLALTLFWSQNTS